MDFWLSQSLDQILGAMLDFARQQPGAAPYNILLTVSLVWLASGPVLSVVLSLYALNFSSWMARRRGITQLKDNGELVSEPFVQFSRALFAIYAIAGVIAVPTFFYYLLLLSIPGAELSAPFAIVLLINFSTLVVVFIWALLCHFLAGWLWSVLNHR